MGGSRLSRERMLPADLDEKSRATCALPAPSAG
jgi:hypothetical protein